MDNLIVTTIARTRLDNTIKPEDATKTDLTLDFNEISKEDMIPWCIKSLRIHCQDIWRKQGHIPTEQTVIVKPVEKRERAVKSPNIDKMTREQQLDLLRQLEERLATS